MGYVQGHEDQVIIAHPISHIGAISSYVDDNYDLYKFSKLNMILYYTFALLCWVFQSLFAILAFPYVIV